METAAQLPLFSFDTQSLVAPLNLMTAESRYLRQPTMLQPLSEVSIHNVFDPYSPSQGLELRWVADASGFKGGNLTLVIPNSEGKSPLASKADLGVRMWIKINEPGNRLNTGVKEALIAFLTGIAIFEAAGTQIFSLTGGQIFHSEKAMAPSVPLFRAQVALGNYDEIPFGISGFYGDTGEGYYLGIFPQNDSGLQQLVKNEAVNWLVEIAKNRSIR